MLGTWKCGILSFRLILCESLSKLEINSSYYDAVVKVKFKKLPFVSFQVTKPQIDHQ